ncbi:hypothetical protein CK203_059807 [Vitis vinifera]|uniref:Uncharacterized protein n=1 Tax=Vitis vinifera TaxID=29760 RepID=A0A438GB06_VITVI|nr:hypothetical protein CK203_059807 [Vitis vinifera]
MLTRFYSLCSMYKLFAAEYLKTPLGEPVKGKKNKSSTELWLEKFYKKKTNLPEPLPHELVERLEKFLDNLEEELGRSIIPVIRSSVTRCTSEQLRNFTKHYLHPTIPGGVFSNVHLRWNSSCWILCIFPGHFLFISCALSQNHNGCRPEIVSKFQSLAKSWLSCAGSEEIEGVEGLKDNMDGLTGLNIKYNED